MVLIEGDVMYSVEIRNTDYYNWSAYDEWDPLIDGSFQSYFMLTYPEIISCDRRGRFGEPTYRTFVFESEEHYHWFLLKVM